MPIVHKEIVVGKSSVLKCFMDENVGVDTNQLSREWFKDNKPIYITSTLDSARYYYTLEKELLIIVNTQSVDAGQYRCEVTDDSNINFSVLTDLIVVQEHFNSPVIVIVAALVTLACIFTGSLIVWTILQCHKRKLNATDIDRSCGLIISTSDARVAAIGNNINTFSGNNTTAFKEAATNVHGFGSSQDVVCRTNLHKNKRLHECFFLAQRPRSIAALELTELHCERENCVHDFNKSFRKPPKNSSLIVTSSSNYEQLLFLQRLKMDEQQGLLSEESNNIAQSYWRRNIPTDLYHHQDYLSSKDSGTESDAAIKRSLEDVTLNMLKDYHANCQPAHIVVKISDYKKNNNKNKTFNLNQDKVVSSLDTCVEGLLTNHSDEEEGDKDGVTRLAVGQKLFSSAFTV